MRRIYALFPYVTRAGLTIAVARNSSVGDSPRAILFGAYSYDDLKDAGFGARAREEYEHDLQVISSCSVENAIQLCLT